MNKTRERTAVWQSWGKTVGRQVKVKMKSWSALKARLRKKFSLESVCTCESLDILTRVSNIVWTVPQEH